jgi:hypothetical protein
MIVEQFESFEHDMLAEGFYLTRVEGDAYVFEHPKGRAWTVITEIRDSVRWTVRIYAGHRLSSSVDPPIDER